MEFNTRSLSAQESRVVLALRERGQREVIRFALTAVNAPKSASPQYDISIWIWIPTARLASLRSGLLMPFPRQPQSSRHQFANIRSSGA